MSFVKVGSVYVNPLHVVSLEFKDYDKPYQIDIELVTGTKISEEYYEKSIAESVLEEITSVNLPLKEKY